MSAYYLIILTNRVQVMANKAPGKAHREGISLIELIEMFPDDDSARTWFEDQVWPDGRHCPRCGSTETIEATGNPPMPYWCPPCRRQFSVRTRTALERSKVPFRKWAIAIYLEMTSLKGVSSMKLHRDLGVTQKTAWFMLHRIREAWASECHEKYKGLVEVDEAYIGGLEKNKHVSKKLKAGRGSVGKAIVIGAKDQSTNQVSAEVVQGTNKQTLQCFVVGHVEPGATVFTDEHSGYTGMPFDHHAVKHSTGEYVKQMPHVNGIESFWATLKRAHKGVYHKISPEHLQRYVAQFAGKHNMRDNNTIDQMSGVAAKLVGKRLMYRDLIA